MSSRFLHLVLLRAGGRTLSKCDQSRTINVYYNISVSKQFSMKSDFLLSGKKTLSGNSKSSESHQTHCNNKKMPIIPAVIAHRHFYHHQQQLLQQKTRQLQFMYPIVLQSSELGIEAIHATDGLLGNCVTNNAMRGSMGSVLAKSLELTHLGHHQWLHTKESRRYYAKGKDRVKNKKATVVLNEDEINSVVDYQSFKRQMNQLIEQMKDDLTKQFSVRGSSGALESISVEFEGEVYPLQELAQVGRKNPQLAVLNLSSLPDACQPVIKAIQDSGMNLNPQQEGTTIYVPLPKVTREHREGLAKNAKALFTKYKTLLQSVQNRFIKQCKSQTEISDDTVFSVQQQLTKITESYVSEAENLVTAKQKELLETK